MAALAFEIEHRVDHVLEHAGARDRAVLGDMADQQHGDAAPLGQFDEGLGRGAHLRHGSRRGIDGVEPHGLDRIDHRDAGSVGPLERGHDVAHRRGGNQLDRRVRKAQPFCAEPHLVDGFLAGDVGASGVLFGQRRRHLQQERRLADARIAADQQGRAHDQAAAAHTVELVDAALETRRLRCRAGEAGEFEQAAAFSTLAARHHRAGRAGGGAGFLGDRVPLAARFAAAIPLGGDRAARLADEALEGPGHQCNSCLLRHQPSPCSQHESSASCASRRRLRTAACPMLSSSARLSAARSASLRAPAQG